MKPIDESKCRDQVSPLDQKPESVEEENLRNTLELLVCAGKISRDDVFYAWKLAFTA